MAKFRKPPTLLIRTGGDTDLFDGIIEECDALGWRIVNLNDLGDYLDLEDPPIGAIIGVERPVHMIARLRKMSVPIVRICTPVQEGFECDASIAEDRYGGGRLAADAFLERGFRELGYVSYGVRPSDDELYLGFQQQAETVCDTRVHVYNFTKTHQDELGPHERFVAEVATWLEGLPKPLALFAANLKMSTRIILACERAGLSVPEQVAIACRGNDERSCRTSLVPMSAIDMNLTEMGRQAVQLIHRFANGEDPPDETIHVPVKGFAPRRSTDILAVSDPKVAKAMRFMWDHINWPISVDDVALEVSTSRATLERAFRRTLGRGISAELRRKRLETCKEMLRTTKRPLAQIAKAIGFNSTNHLHRAFKTTFATTPQQYRRSFKAD